MKRAIVLSGGGARGAFQVGALRHLVTEKRLDFDILRGVSVGSLNTAYLAQAPTGSRSQLTLSEQAMGLEKLWLREIEGNHSIYFKNWGAEASLLTWSDALYSVKPLKRLLRKHLDPDRLYRSGRDFKVGTVSLVDGHYKEWRPEDGRQRFIDRILASSSIPVVFPPVRFRDEEDLLVDGGVRNITPLADAFAAGAEEIYVILSGRLIPEADGSLPRSSEEAFTYSQWDDNWLGTAVNGLSILRRAIALLTDEIYLDDIRHAIDWNQFLWRAEKIVSAYETMGGHGDSAAVSLEAKKLRNFLRQADKRYVPIHVLAPRQWYGNSDDPIGERSSAMDFSPNRIREAIRHGYEIARDPDKWLYSSSSL